MSEERVVLQADEVELASRPFTTYGVTLPYTTPAYPSLGHPAKTGVAFITVDELEELNETASFYAVLSLGGHGDYALEQAGWARKQTRGGVVATDDFKAIWPDLLNRIRPMREDQPARSAEEVLADVRRLLKKMPVGGVYPRSRDSLENEVSVSLVDITKIIDVAEGEDPATWVSVRCGMTLFSVPVEEGGHLIDHSPHHWTEYEQPEFSSSWHVKAVHYCDGTIEGKN